MTATETPPQLERALLEVLDRKSLLKHPFYVEWTKGTLPLDRLQEYARQYFHFESAFPRFLSAIHARAESPAVRRHLLENLWDEEHGDRNHVALWLEFAASIGVVPEDVRSSAPGEQTVALVEHFRDVCANAPLGEALATLFAYEGQVPRVAWEKMRGLTEHYGLQPSQFEFFSVHLVSDVSHAGAEMAAIAETAGNDFGAVAAAAEQACDRLLAFLDGCYQPVAAL
ncbi:MAG: CADD family putative folate metabolism protein [Dehalococcoidia bacterium]